VVLVKPVAQAPRYRHLRTQGVGGASGVVALGLLGDGQGLALYSRQQWDGAIPEYQRFLTDFPRAVETPAALYRLAECYLKMGNANSARLYWGKLAALPQPGPIGGGAAYRLAEFEFKEREFGEAAAHFKLASQLLQDAKARQSAQYFAARSYQELGRKPEARALYQESEDTYSRANDAASYDDWRRARHQWDYFYNRH
jgi:TolA-binding protein